MILLEVGDLTGLVVMIVGILFLVCFIVSLIFAFIIKVVREAGGDKITRREFWLSFILVFLACAIITGLICSGLIS
jgi:quinol-cytochrome oxidoreductase complex cytochrome b subunit